MDTIPLLPDFCALLKFLNEERVEYFVIGSMAEINYGYHRSTGDLDVWVASSPGKAAGSNNVRRGEPGRTRAPRSDSRGWRLPARSCQVHRSGRSCLRSGWRRRAGSSGCDNADEQTAARTRVPPARLRLRDSNPDPEDTICTGKLLRGLCAFWLIHGCRRVSSYSTASSRGQALPHFWLANPTEIFRELCLQVK